MDLCVIFSSSGSKGGRPGGPGPPTPVKTSQKKDGHCRRPQVSRVIAPRTNFWIRYRILFQTVDLLDLVDLFFKKRESFQKGKPAIYGDCFGRPPAL